VVVGVIGTLPAAWSTLNLTGLNLDRNALTGEYHVFVILVTIMLQLCFHDQPTQLVGVTHEQLEMLWQVPYRPHGARMAPSRR
jgi:hypothetical protein